MNKIISIDEFNKIVSDNRLILAYFSNDNCNVCKVLKPKIIDLLNENFANILFFYCNIDENPEISAQNSVFSIPTIIVFFDGKEIYRFGRFLDINELKVKLGKVYNLIT